MSRARVSAYNSAAWGPRRPRTHLAICRYAAGPATTTTTTRPCTSRIYQKTRNNNNHSNVCDTFKKHCGALANIRACNQLLADSFNLYCFIYSVTCQNTEQITHENDRRSTHEFISSSTSDPLVWDSITMT